MSYNRGLLKSIVSIFNYCSRRSGGILIYSLLGLNFSIMKINAEDNILVIHSYQSELSSVKQQQEGIEQGFAEIDDRSNVYHEFLDSKHHPQLEHGQEFIDYINKKYQRIPISLLMVVDDPSLQLMLRKHEKFFPNIPVVFLGIDKVGS